MVLKVVREALAEGHSPVVSLWMTGETQTRRMLEGKDDTGTSLVNCSTLTSVFQGVLDLYEFDKQTPTSASSSTSVGNADGENAAISATADNSAGDSESEAVTMTKMDPKSTEKSTSTPAHTAGSSSVGAAAPDNTSFTEQSTVVDGVGFNAANGHRADDVDDMYLQSATPEKLQAGCPVVVGNDVNLMLGTVVGRSSDGLYQIDLISGERVDVYMRMLRCVNVTAEQAREAFKQAVRRFCF